MIELTWTLPGEPPIPDEPIERAVDGALRHGKRPGLHLAVVFVDDATLADMHGEHLGDPTETDVMAFDLGEEGAGPAGEIYVSVDRARAVAERRGADLLRELSLYVVHGVLHLCGYDDHDPGDREHMRAAESAVMTDLGFPPDPLPHEHGTG